MNSLPSTELRVLIVDDEPYILKLLRRILVKIGIENIQEATDGADALAKMETCEVDFIISDIMMTPMNGLKFLKMIRSGLSSADSKIPFVVFTGSDESSVFGTALSLDCDAFVSKQGSPQELLDRINTILSEDRRIAKPTNYLTITIPDIVNDSVPISSGQIAQEEISSDSICMMIHQAESGDVLGRDLKTKDGYMLFPAGTILTSSCLNRLSDVEKLVGLPELWIVK